LSPTTSATKWCPTKERGRKKEEKKNKEWRETTILTVGAAGPASELTSHLD